jgi:hypothetical protein
LKFMNSHRKTHTGRDGGAAHGAAQRAGVVNPDELDGAARRVRRGEALVRTPRALSVSGDSVLALCHADGSGGEIVLEHCNGVKGKDGPGQYLGTPGLPDLTDHGECGAIRAASALLPHDQLATLTLCRLR